MKTNYVLLSAMIAAAIAIGTQTQAQGGVAAEKTKERHYFPDVLVIQTADYAVLEKKYAACLNSENDGVVESALAHMAIFKLMYPIKEFRTLQRAIETAAHQHPSLEIRAKAKLVMALYETPEIFVSEARTDYASPTELFETLASKFLGTIVSNTEK